MSLSDVTAYLSNEWKIIRKAPLSFLVTVLVTAGAIWWAASNHFQERLDVKQALVESKEAEITRYKLALGLEEGQSSLVSLTNDELRIKARGIAQNLRDFRQRVNDRWKSVSDQTKAEKDPKKQEEIRNRAQQENGRDFAECCRAEAMNVRAELKIRLPKSTVASHVPFGLLLTLAGGQQLSLLPTDMLPAEHAFFFADALANEIEQLAALL